VPYEVGTLAVDGWAVTFSTARKGGIWTSRSSALSFPGAKSPQRELSLTWNLRSLEHSLSGSEKSKYFCSLKLLQCSRPRSHALTLFKRDAPVHRHMNTSAAPTSSSRRRCMPSSTCPDIPRHRRNASAGADGDGVQRPVRTGGTRSPPRGTAIQPQPAQAPPRCTKCNSLPIIVMLYDGPLRCGAILMSPLKG